ncbi:MAG: acetylglutamate kinase [Deltaproteobacteria bacterium]|nr:MAG: acetylglutamate kinase [Deltaproteobacteria bacterium]
MTQTAPGTVETEGTVADILIESLPYIRRFSGKTVVIKYGGHAMVDAQLKTDFARDITLMRFIGINPVVIHGGGPQINEVLDSMGIRPQFVRGMRLTDEPTMDVVEMVLGGKLNKAIVNLINQEGGTAVGLTGKDGGLIQAEKLTVVQETGTDTPPEIIDPGLVGRVTEVRPQIIHTLSAKGFIPIIAPVGTGAGGETFNINADFVASKVAVALKAERLILLTDVDGLFDGNGALLSSLVGRDVQNLITDGVIQGGMIPKTECAVEALDGGVEKVHILNGKRPHAILLELFTDGGIGTEFVREASGT